MICDEPSPEEFIRSDSFSVDEAARRVSSGRASSKYDALCFASIFYASPIQGKTRRGAYFLAGFVLPSDNLSSQDFIYRVNPEIHFPFAKVPIDFIRNYYRLVAFSRRLSISLLFNCEEKRRMKRGHRIIRLLSRSLNRCRICSIEL